MDQRERGGEGERIELDLAHNIDLQPISWFCPLNGDVMLLRLLQCGPFTIQSHEWNNSEVTQSNPSHSNPIPSDSIRLSPLLLFLLTPPKFSSSSRRLTHFSLSILSVRVRTLHDLCTRQWSHTPELSLATASHCYRSVLRLIWFEPRHLFSSRRPSAKSSLESDVCYCSPNRGLSVNCFVCHIMGRV